MSNKFMVCVDSRPIGAYQSGMFDYDFNSNALCELAKWFGDYGERYGDKKKTTTAKYSRRGCLKKRNS